MDEVMVLPFLVFRHGAVGIVPRAEIVELAAYLLRPTSCRVGDEGEVGVGLARLGGRGRMTCGYGDCSFAGCHSVLGRLLSRPASS